MQPSKLALTRGRACPGDRVSERRVDPEDLRVSSALSGTRERTMKMNCTCAAEMLGTGSRDPLGLHHIPDSVPTAPAPLPGSYRAPAAWLESCVEPPAASVASEANLRSRVHTTRERGKEVKCLKKVKPCIIIDDQYYPQLFSQTYMTPSTKTKHRKSCLGTTEKIKYTSQGGMRANEPTNPFLSQR